MRATAHSGAAICAVNTRVGIIDLRLSVSVAAYWVASGEILANGKRGLDRDPVTWSDIPVGGSSTIKGSWYCAKADIFEKDILILIMKLFFLPVLVTTIRKTSVLTSV